MFDDLRDLDPAESDDETTATPTDDILSGFGEPEPVTATPAEDIPSAFSAPDFGSDPLFGDATVTASSSGSGLVLGMTAQQRAVLSAFLFLDVAMLSCVFLLALERISIP